MKDLETNLLEGQSQYLTFWLVLLIDL